MRVFYILVTLAFTCSSWAAPMKQDIEEDPELTPGYFEGDIVLEDTRNGLSNNNFRWPDNIVYYRIHDGFFDDEHVDHIMRAMRNIEDVSCIRFMEASADQKSYVNITGLSDGCYSSVGYRNRVQTFNLKIFPLDKGCFRIGSIIHEFLHTLGFYHMQSSSDRDEYVRIAEENIKEGKLHNFLKYDKDFVDGFGEEYDYGSILHYQAYAFSENGEMTIIPLKEDLAPGIMGQRLEMSRSDINRLNSMYNCPLDV